MTEQEAIAGLQLLAAIAQADGRIDDRERAALGRAIDEFKVPGAPSAEALLSQPVDFDAALAQITSRDGQRAVFGAAVAMALVDGTNSPEERALVDRMRVAFELSDAATPTMFSRVLGRASMQPIADPEARRATVRATVQFHAVLAGVMGSLPSPVLDGLMVTTQQLAMLSKIAAHWGTTVTVRQFLVAGATVVAGNAALLAAASFLKLVPVWGSVLGAGIAYVNTAALGTVFDDYLRRNGEMSSGEVREAMARARKAARTDYDADKVRVDAARTASGPTVESLSKDFVDGKITIEEFERRVEEVEGLRKPAAGA